MEENREQSVSRGFSVTGSGSGKAWTGPAGFRYMPPMATLFSIDEGQGPACLLVHAFPFDGRMWEAQRAELSKDHRVLVPDLRGFGRSANLAPARSVDEHADDLAELLDHANVKDAAVLGLSMGGYVALALFRRHPSRVRALVLADTRALPDSPEAKAARDVNIAIAREQGMPKLVDKLMPPLLAKDAAPSVVQRVRALAESQTVSGVTDALVMLRDRPDSRPLLPTISVPTAVIVGEFDALSPVAEMKEMADAIPGATFTVIPGAGHLTNLESPEAFNAALRAGVGY